MHAALELEPRKHALARDRRDDFLEAAEVALRHRNHFRLPAPEVGIAHIHAIEIGGEEGGLVAARARAHFKDGAAFIGGILGQQRDLELSLEVLEPVADSGKFVVGKRDHLFAGSAVARQDLQIGLIALSGAQCIDPLDHGIEVGKLFAELGKRRLVGAALIELRLDRLPALHQSVELLGRDRVHAAA